VDYKHPLVWNGQLEVLNHWQDELRKQLELRNELLEVLQNQLVQMGRQLLILSKQLEPRSYAALVEVLHKCLELLHMLM
jgi:hypothetical protein